jgi:hypothetical protein
MRVRPCYVLVCAALGVETAHAQPDVLASAIYAAPAGNNKVYLLLSNSTWTDAQARAVELGGHLACIDDAAEHNFVYTTYRLYGGVRRNLWIGLSDANQASNSNDRITRRTEFAWVNAQQTSYTNWSPAEPLNPLSGEPGTPEYYVHIWQPNDFYAGRWNNYTNSLSLFGVPLYGVVETCAYTPRIASIARCPGAGATFSVAPVGVGPFTFRWRRDGQLLDIAQNPSAATSTLTLTSVSALSAGNYDCVVANACGSVVSNAANLFVGCASPANVAGPGQEPTCDGVLTADDIIVFLNWWFAADPRADIARQGQVPQPDGAFTADDLIYYINLFFQGC